MPNRKLINKTRLCWAKCKGSQFPGPNSFTRGSLLAPQVSRRTPRHLLPTEMPPSPRSLTYSNAPSSWARAAGEESCALPCPPAPTSAPPCRHQGAPAALPAAVQRQGLSRHTAPSPLLPKRTGIYIKGYADSTREARNGSEV